MPVWLYGLKLSVIGDSSVVTIVSGLPIDVAEFELVPDEVDELQAAAPSARSATAATLYESLRFIAPKLLSARPAVSRP